MNAEEYYRKKDYPILDKFDKKAPKFDYYDFIDFAESYYKAKLNLLTIPNVVRQSEQSKCVHPEDVINCPDELEPVLAKIEHISSLGKSNWYEVVYYVGQWRSYSGSKTFNDGEKVVKWKYCKGCL